MDDRAKTPELDSATAGVVIVLIAVSSVRSWQYPPLPDLHFGRYAREFQAAPRGTSFSIPINPIGWSLTLVNISHRTYLDFRPITRNCFPKNLQASGNFR